jgi:hypothetical protein
MAARITGKLAAVYLGTTPTKVADIFDWVFTTDTVALRCDIKSDRYAKYSPAENTATLSAKRYNQTDSVLMALVQDAAVNGTQLLFRIDLVDNDTGFNQIQGQGFVTTGSLNAPRGMVEDTFQVTLDGAWAFV